MYLSTYLTFTHNMSSIAFSAGPFDVRWYGLMYAVGLTLTYLLILKVFKEQKYKTEHLDSLVIYLFFGLVIGARLGHCFFYNAEYFLANPVEILKVWNGGLASHGGAIGVFLAYLLWSKIHKVKFIKYPDALVIGFPIIAGFIRVGNFMNSEIVGYPTDSYWGVIFKQLGEDFPRHPVQLYSALMNWVIGIILYILYKKYYKKTPPLFFMFLYMLLYFSGRFIVEFWKDLQGPIEDLPIQMGQLLSVFPVVIAVVYFVFFYPKQKARKS